jgi:hypothetical protein
MLAGVVKVLCSVRAALTTTAGISVAANTDFGNTAASMITLMENTLFKETSNNLEATRNDRNTEINPVTLCTLAARRNLVKTRISHQINEPSLDLLARW